jgi:hypothetical protein
MRASNSCALDTPVTLIRGDGIATTDGVIARLILHIALRPAVVRGDHVVSLDMEAGC